MERKGEIVGRCTRCVSQQDSIDRNAAASLTSFVSIEPFSSRPWQTFHVHTRWLHMQRHQAEFTPGKLISKLPPQSRNTLLPEHLPSSLSSNTNTANAALATLTCKPFEGVLAFHSHDAMSTLSKQQSPSFLALLLLTHLTPSTFAQSLVNPTTAAPSATPLSAAFGYEFVGCWNETTGFGSNGGARALGEEGKSVCLSPCAGLSRRRRWMDGGFLRGLDGRQWIRESWLTF